MKPQKWITCLITTVLCCFGISRTISAEEFLPGGSAEQVAIEAYETWMQFAQPDLNTPAVDEDGCLNYALAKMAVRYNLPVDGVNAFDDSYTYYTTFTESLLSATTSKMQYIAETYHDYLTREDSIWLSGDIQQRMKQAYAVCAENGDSTAWCYVLQMKTASGSDHYVLVDHVDLENERLYLLDSGSRYTHYLGDEKTIEKGYFITAVHPFQIQSVPGDCNNDKQLTEEDVILLLEQTKQNAQSLRTGDADHNGIVNASDAVYIAKIAWYQTQQSVSCDIQMENYEIRIATPNTMLQEQQPPVIPGGWNSQIFQNQLTED